MDKIYSLIIAFWSFSFVVVLLSVLAIMYYIIKRRYTSIKMYGLMGIAWLHISCAPEVYLIMGSFPWYYIVSGWITTIVTIWAFITIPTVIEEGK